MEGPRAALPWSANLFWLASLACLCIGTLRFACLLAAVAVACGLSTLGFYRWSHLLDGYYCWITSLLALMIGSAVAWTWRLRAGAIANRANSPLLKSDPSALS